MGDLRNKMAKQLRDAKRHAYTAKRYPSQPPEPLPACLRGFTWNDVSFMWAMERLQFLPATALTAPAIYLHSQLELRPARLVQLAGH